MPIQLIDVSHWFLINMSLRVGFRLQSVVSILWCNGVAIRSGFMLPSAQTARRTHNVLNLSARSFVCCQTYRGGSMGAGGRAPSEISVPLYPPPQKKTKSAR